METSSPFKLLGKLLRPVDESDVPKQQVSPFDFVKGLMKPVQDVVDKTLPPRDIASEETQVPYKITPEFRNEVGKVATNLGVDPNHLLAAMHFETGGSFRPDQKNAAGSGATGLIQFMPSTLKGLGTTTEKAAKMTQVEQLGLVERYFQPYKGKLKSLSDVYMAILWPRAVGKPDDYVLFSNDNPASQLYAQNRGLDFNKDGKITKAEATMKVAESAKAVGEPA